VLLVPKTESSEGWQAYFRIPRMRQSGPALPVVVRSVTAVPVGDGFC
jgi:hypothetical protein